MAALKQIIFVKPNGTALLLEGEDFKNYQRLHNDGTKMLKIKGVNLEEFKGAKIQFNILPLDSLLKAQAEKQMPDKIIFVYDSGQAVLLENEDFQAYQKNHLAGLKLISAKAKIIGIKIRIEIIR